MSGRDEPGPVEDDEYLYRRIPVSMKWYQPESNSLSPEAFGPHRTNDTTGLSVDRARSENHPCFRTIEQSGQGRSTQGYYVAVLRAGDLRAHGIVVVDKPEDDNPGHAELPGLNSADRKSDQVEEWKVLLSHKLTLRVEGPYSTDTQSSD